MRTNLHHLVEHTAGVSGNRPALTFKKTTCTYSDLWSRVRGVAAGLQAMGLQHEQRVAILLDKRIETVAAIFGTSAAGGAFVPVNPLLKPAQVAYVLSNCDVRVLITTPERLNLLSGELENCPALEHVVVIDSQPMSGTTAGIPYRLHRWVEVFDSAGAEFTPASTVDLDIAAILYTSGSTGKPKGVVLSHRNLIVGAESVSQYLGNTAEDVILSALPLSFDAGLSQLTTGFSVGAHVILMNYLLPGDVVRMCAAHGVTGLTCVPPLWIQIAEQTWPAEVAGHLRYFANTGGRMPKPTLERLREHFPSAKPYLMYGLTEAFRSTYLDPAEVDRRPDSIGKAIPNAEILVVRPDGTSCGPGEEGELVHRGPLVALGYWNDPARTAERFRPAPGRADSWRAPEIAVYSGDSVVSDDEGFLYFVGRTDDMIKTSGYRVSPTEIEEVAYGTGLVRDAVALGLEHPTLGQHIVVVATSAGPAELDVEALLSAMRAELPKFMVPAVIHARETLPTSPNGKFDRALIRQELTR